MRQIKEEGEIAETKKKVAPKWLGILWPSKGTGKMNMIRKEYEKKHILQEHREVSGT